MTSTTLIDLSFRPRVTQIALAQHEAGDSSWHLPKLWCLHLYNYFGEVVINNERLAIRPGSASVQPPAAKSEYHFRGSSAHLYVHFRLQNPRREHALQMPLMQHLGREFLLIYRDLSRAVEVFPRWPTMTEVTVWQTLWTLADQHWRTDEKPKRRHPAVDRTIEVVERRLQESLHGEDLAKEVDLSHHHLIRLFREATGMTLRQYIRERRMQRAQYLLLHSTFSIKAIASQVGIGDLHFFNKAIHRALGKSPREARG